MNDFLSVLLSPGRVKELRNELTDDEISTIEKNSLLFHLSELQVVAKSEEAPAYMKALAMAILVEMKEGKTTTIEKLRDRQYGKPGGARPSIAPKPQPALLPAEPSADDRRRIERRVKSKKAYIVKLLKEQGKYTAELTYQVEITARLLARADMLSDEIMQDGYKAVNVEYSREGNERLSVNPKEKLYLDVLRQGQKALQALGMNTEAKERKTDNDTFNEFMHVMREDEE